MKKVIKVLHKTEEVVVGLLFTIMIFATFAQVVNRTIIQVSIGWLEELARYSMAYMVFLGAEIGFRKNSQMSLDILTKRLSPIYSRILFIISKIITILFLGIVSYYSFDILSLQFKTGQLSPGMQIPMYIPYFSLVILGLIAIVQLFSLIQYIKEKEGE